MDGRNIAKNIFGCSRNNSVLCNGRVENTCFMALELPKGWKTVYQTKIWISDVYWLHIKGEKVIKCDIGYEAAKEYIEEHNSAEELKDIRIDPYGGMSDTAIYDSQFDETFWQQPDRDDYIIISYFKKWRP